MCECEDLACMKAFEHLGEHRGLARAGGPRDANAPDIVRAWRRLRDGHESIHRSGATDKAPSPVLDEIFQRSILDLAPGQLRWRRVFGELLLERGSQSALDQLPPGFETHNALRVVIPGYFVLDTALRNLPAQAGLQLRESCGSGGRLRIR